jgi:hypothetical protein
MELVSNRHLSSISYMKCRYVGGKYMHFMTTNSPAEWIILRMACDRKLANRLSYSEHWINFHIIYYPLYVLIKKLYHDSSRMHDFSHVPDSGQCQNFGCIS